MTKTSVTIDIDLDKIAADFLEKDLYEGDSYRWTVEKGVKDQIREQARDFILSEIRKSLNIEDFRLKGSFTKEYLTEQARNILTGEMKKVIDEHIAEWFKRNLEGFVLHHVRSILEKLLLPRMNQVIASLLVVNEEAAKEEIEALQRDLQTQADSSFEAGQQAAHDEIRRHL